ncbi:HAMP domain-containing histidine kinase [Brevibacillus ruminantium]|uniref:histidine kinase n=1 Tax=Brevibacillus ruminantium TaxID=2950604 RepID=A0ABY4WE61_9BACL|nr:HAMP domain-containing sensor histidine kinase [Brevibacillus ruminantium]USG65024.1 HAMP domain-containing histidine kinase [Brevibacillus ruminantium]
MTIRVKLLLSYIGMILIPMIIFFPLSYLLSGFFLGDFQEGSESRQGTPQELGQDIKKLMEQRDELFAGLQFMARYEPERLTDRGFLEKADAEFKQLQSGFVVLKEDSVIYVSSFLEGVDWAAELQSGSKQRDKMNFHGREMDGHLAVNTYEFPFQDHRPGTIYLFTDTKSLFQTFKKVIPAFFLTFLIVIGLTNALLTYLISRSIIKPLYALKRATEHIKEGNLDYEVGLKRKDEIGELSAAFEEMRCRLKESIHLQLQYEENRKELISNISHDLKTPITGIKGCVEGVLDGIADTQEKQEKYMRMIYKKATEMDRLIDELFLFSKLDLKRLPFHFEQIDLVAYLTDFVEELRHDPRKQGISFYFSPGVNPSVYVLADREKLSRVMTNIVNNSVNYMQGESKEIRLGLRDSEKQVTVVIEDNGVGITSEALPHIFERFYRAEPSRQSKNGGSGLGLAIVKQIVEEHGGQVWAESKQGEGTRIFFTLPKTNGASGERI